MNIVFFLLLLGSALAASFRYGGAPERVTAAMLAAAALLSHLLYQAPPLRYYTVESSVAIVDVLLLAGITVVLLTADRFWPIAMFAAHGVTVLAHAIKTMDVSIIRHAYAISIAAPAYATLAILFVAIVRHQSRLRSDGADRAWSRPSRRG